jgi:hypothetical protein
MIPKQKSQVVRDRLRDFLRDGRTLRHRPPFPSPKRCVHNLGHCLAGVATHLRIIDERFEHSPRLDRRVLSEARPPSLNTARRKQTMNRKIATALVVAAAAVAGNAFADDITVETTPFTSTASRAQVQAELQAYKQAGVNPWATSYNPLRSFKSGKTRAEVTAEYLNSRDEVAALTAEDSGSAYLTQLAAGRTPNQYFAGQPARSAQ